MRETTRAHEASSADWRILRAAIVGAGVLAAIAGCEPTTVEVDFPSKLMSAGDSDPPGPVASLMTWQSEQSVVRAFDVRTGEAILVVGFNDGGGTFDQFGNQLLNKNKMGYAVSRDDGVTWTYANVPVVTSTTAEVTDALGDPWMATNAARDRIYYLNLGRTRFGFGDGPNELLVSVHDAAGGLGFWRAPFVAPPAINQLSVSTAGGEPGNDKPSMAVSPDTLESVYLTWQCGLATCNPASTNLVHLLRIDGAGATSRLTEFDAGGPVVNPIVAVDRREPNSVFIVYGVASSQVPPVYTIHLAKSFDRGVTFPGAFRVVLATGTAPDQDIHTATSRLLSNGNNHDYFVADDGWHYVVWEHQGEVFFNSAAALSTYPGDGRIWGTARRLSIEPVSDRQNSPDFQPVVAASGNRVAVVFYTQSSRLTASTSLTAWVSDNRGATPSDGTLGWRIGTISRDDSGAALFFQPCPLENRLGNYGYYGDYIDVVPMALPGVADDRFFATWTASPGECIIANGLNAVPHHTYGTTFR